MLAIQPSEDRFRRVDGDELEPGLQVSRRGLGLTILL